MVRLHRSERITRTADIAKSILLLMAATAVGMVFKKMNMSDSNVVMAYIIGVLLTAVVTSRKVYSLMSSAVSVLAFNYFFTVPYFTLKAYSDDYPVTFLTMFLTAFITSTLAVQMKQQMKESSEAAFRTQILLETNQMIQQKSDRLEMVTVVAGQLGRLLKRDIVFYLAEEQGLSDAFFYSAGYEERQETLQKRFLEKAECTSEYEYTVAEWVYGHREEAGATTGQMAAAKCLYLPISAREMVYGVVGIPISGEGLEPFERNITLSILGECALALEREQALREREESALLAKNEQLRANLLRSISHDLRTPLTTISGNAGILLANADDMDAASRSQLYANIYDDAQWLINLVENLLSVTRIEDGTMKLHLSTELMDEVITEALQHVNRKKEAHQITVEPSDGFYLAKIDAKLVMQVIVNLVDNAIKYTPPGSKIHIATYRREGWIVVEVKDNGHGIPDEAKQHIFDRFFVVEKDQGVVDSRRSLGLGLFLCRTIITAHGGEIQVLDNQPCGAIFRFTLPEEEVTLRE